MKKPVNIAEHKSMGDLTWFRSGGSARYYLAPSSDDELIEATKWAFEQRLPLHLLGLGANSLFPDEEYPGLILHMTRFRQTGEHYRSHSSDVVEVDAGVNLENLVKKLNSHGLGGFEKFVGIPGTVGGSVWGNAGAQNSCLGDRVDSLRILDSNGEANWISGDRIPWKYRSSGLGKRIILGARFFVEPDRDPVELQNLSDDFLKYKKSVQPYDEKSTGCIFKNPAEGPSAGKLIDELQLKGLREGGAQVSSLHGNFIVNSDQTATTSDVLTLVDRVRKKVYEEQGVQLEREVIVVGEANYE